MTKKSVISEDVEYNLLKRNVQEVVKTRQGREVIWHILGLCNIYSDSFTGNSSTFYNEGRRSVGLQILQLLGDADPGIYPRLVLEKNSNEEK